jgi:hypothetical protein
MYFVIVFLDVFASFPTTVWISFFLMIKEFEGLLAEVAAVVFDAAAPATAAAAADDEDE